MRLSFVFAVCLALSATAGFGQITFTGDVPADFGGVAALPDPLGDVGVPVNITGPSGWDIQGIYVSYDSGSDTLFVGIDSDGILGDVDGDGDGGTSSPGLITNGGTDIPDLGGSETVALSLDFNNDGTPEIVVGNPFGTDINNFVVASFVGTIFAPQFAFGPPIAGVTANVPTSPNAAAPDLEFTIANFSILTSTFGAVDNPAIGFNYFGGSIDDDGIGEDSTPGAGQLGLVSLPGAFAKLGDTVFIDVDGNGAQGGMGETGVPGVTVNLFDTTGTLLGTAVTDANGNYEFCVPPGDYCIEFVPSSIPAGFTGFTSQDAGGDDSTDSDADPLTGKTGTITVGAGDNDDTNDAGITPAVNTPPVPGNLPPNNKIDTTVGVPATFTITFDAPEAGQNITSITVNDFGLAGFSCDPPVIGANQGSITCTFTPMNSQVGMTPMIDITATDDDPFNPLSTTVTITFCVAECFMIVGTTPINAPISGMNDILLVHPGLIRAMTLDNMPAFPTPNTMSLMNVTVYMQGVMINPDFDPADPVKMTPRLRITFGGGSAVELPHLATGMTISDGNGGQSYMPGDTLTPEFTIDGF